MDFVVFSEKKKKQKQKKKQTKVSTQIGLVSLAKN